MSSTPQTILVKKSDGSQVRMTREEFAVYRKSLSTASTASSTADQAQSPKTDVGNGTATQKNELDTKKKNTQPTQEKKEVPKETPTNDTKQDVREQSEIALRKEGAKKFAQWKERVATASQQKKDSSDKKAETSADKNTAEPTKQVAKKAAPTKTSKEEGTDRGATTKEAQQLIKIAKDYVDRINEFLSEI